ncbi:unnamed protein product [Rhizophagus irregularis]|nr:unnamed protein product [Rhizophagus irregularis]
MYNRIEKKTNYEKRRDIDIEKANQLIKKSKTHSNKEAAEICDKEVVVEIVACSSTNREFKIGTRNEQRMLLSHHPDKIPSMGRKYQVSFTWREVHVKNFKEIRKNRFLSRQLVAVNISELTRNGGFDILVNFVRETFRVSWNGKICPPFKELDNITKELMIPSRSGNKIVDSLSL